MAETVRAVVRDGPPVVETAILAIMPTTVVQANRPRFVALALEEFKTLHAGNAIRFGLRPLEFAAWQEMGAERG